MREEISTQFTAVIAANSNWISQLAYALCGTVVESLLAMPEGARLSVVINLTGPVKRIPNTKAIKPKASGKGRIILYSFPLTEMKSNGCQERGTRTKGGKSGRDNGVFAFTLGCLS